MTQRLGRNAITAFMVGAMATSTVVVTAPAALAESGISVRSADNFKAVQDGDKYLGSELSNAGLAKTGKLGWGWCIDGASNIPAPTANYDLGKMTHAVWTSSDGSRIVDLYADNAESTQLRNALLTLAEGMSDGYESGDLDKAKEYQLFFRALAGSYNGEIRQLRAAVRGVFSDYTGGYNNHLARFKELTGYTIDNKNNLSSVGQPAKTYDKSAYITIGAPKGFQLFATNTKGDPNYAKKYTQRILTPYQPGIKENPPQPTPETTPAQPTTVTQAVPTTVTKDVPTTAVETVTVTKPNITERVTETVMNEKTTKEVITVPAEPTTVVKNVTNITNYYNYSNVSNGGSIDLNFEWSHNQGDVKIVEGGEDFDVKVDENGKLVVIGKNGKTSGTVVVVITDKKGNEHKITINVDGGSNTSTEVNNYIIKIGDGESTKLIDGKIVIVNDSNKDKNGNPLVIIENGAVKVNPDRTSGGTVVINITDNNGKVIGTYTIVVTEPTKVQELNINLEHSDNQKQTGTIVIDGAVTYEVEQGGTIISVDNNGKITPKDGQSGTAIVIVKDKDGKVIGRVTVNVTYNDTQVSLLEQNITIEGNSANNTDKHKFTLTVTGDYKVDSYESDKVTVTLENGRLVVTPVDGFVGKTDIVLKDAKGNTITIHVTVTPAKEDTTEVANNNVEVTIKDNQTYQVSRTDIVGTITKTNVDTTIADVIQVPGGFEVVPVKGAEGTIEFEVTLQGGSTITYKVNVEPTARYLDVAEQVVTIPNTHPGFTINKGETTNVIVLVDENGKEISSSDVIDVDVNTGKVTPKKDAKGTAYIEERDARGNVLVRYIVNVTEGTVVKDTKTVTEKTELTINRGGSNTTLVVKEGSEFYDVKEISEGVFHVVTKLPNGATSGKIVVEERSSNGTVLKEYTINVTPAEKTTVKENYANIWNTSTVVVTPGASDHTLKITSGGNIAKIDKNSNGTWTLDPNDGAEGLVVVEETTADGTVVAHYNVTVLKKNDAAQPGKGGNIVIDKDSDAISSGKITINGSDKAPNSGAVEVTQGKDLITVTKDPKTGEIIITKKDGAGSGIAVVAEKDKDGNVVREITITVRPDGTISTDDVKTDNKGGISKDGVVVDNNGSTIVVKDGESAVVRDQNGNKLDIVIERKSDGTIVLRDKDGNILTQDKLKELSGGNNVIVVVIDRSGQVVKESTTDVTPDKKGGDEDNNNNNGGTQTDNGSSGKDNEGSSNPTCIATGLAAGLPLLALIPLGLASQVKIQLPGVDQFSNQINGALRDFNTQTQRQLGIFNRDISRAIEGALGGGVKVQGTENAGLILAGTAAVGIGLLLADGVMRACGAEEYTSSHAIQQAAGGEGSSASNATEK